MGEAKSKTFFSQVRRSSETIISPRAGEEISEENVSMDLDSLKNASMLIKQRVEESLCQANSEVMR